MTMTTRTVATDSMCDAVAEELPSVEAVSGAESGGPTGTFGAPSLSPTARTSEKAAEDKRQKRRRKRSPEPDTVEGGRRPGVN